MELDYVKDINEYGESLIRLYDFDQLEAKEFSEVVKQWLQESQEPLDLGSLAFVTPVNCNLLLVRTKEDYGILTQDRTTFYCGLTLEGFEELLELIEPFCHKDTKAYRMLYDLDNPIDFMFHPSGSRI